MPSARLGSVADFLAPRADIILRKAEGAHALDLEGDQLNLRLGPGLAEDVGIELEEAPAPALLRIH